MSFAHTLKPQERDILRRIVKKVHLAYHPEQFVTDREADKVIARLAANAPLSLKAIKALINREMEFREHIEHADVDALVDIARASNDAKEGIAAKLEKRAPNFTGT